MKKLLLLATLLLFSLACFVANGKTIPLSFVQVSTSATLAKISNESDLYQLTINNVSPYITYYTDRPARSTGLATLPNFVSAWKTGKESFQKNNPNAVIYAGLVNGQPNRSNQFYVVQLANPQYNSEKNQITYTVKAIGKRPFIFDNIDFDYLTLIIN